MAELVPIAILAGVLLVGWIVLRFALKLTATLFRLGCFFIFLIVIGLLALRLL